MPMEPPIAPPNQTFCHIRQVRVIHEVLPCDRCGQAARASGTARRTAVDIALDGPVLLDVTVSLHHCPACQHTFRAQPPFLRPDACYTNRVVTKAVQSVFDDGMAMRRVATRLARDFWVRPSEGMIRQWCKTYAAGLDFGGEYQPWVVREFSGILCVDEVYQDRLALLLAVDPAAPQGDRLVGYQLVHGQVDAAAMHDFLARLKAGGIAPEQVITDGSALYPTPLAQVWPQAAHQLCLFHETRAVTAAVERVYRSVRDALPTPPRTSPQVPAAVADQRQATADLRGRPRKQPPADEANDAAAEKWRWRQGREQALRREVRDLRQRGVSLRGIARQTGLDRATVTKWLATEAIPGPTTGDATIESAPPVVREDLAAPTPACPVPSPPGPPGPWDAWSTVRQAGADLGNCRFLLLKRPDHLTADELARLDALLASPLGTPLRIARDFLVAWYAIWRDEDGQRRDPEDATAQWQRWREEPAYRAVAPLRRVQQKVDAARFAKLSQFLREPQWEATNNGAERMGRAFRHRQAPHFTLRTVTTLEDDLKVAAFRRKEDGEAATSSAARRCTRGRKARPAAIAPAA
jgi:hypothetical protein